MAAEGEGRRLGKAAREGSRELRSSKCIQKCSSATTRAVPQRQAWRWTAPLISRLGGHFFTYRLEGVSSADISAESADISVPLSSPFGLLSGYHFSAVSLLANARTARTDAREERHPRALSGTCAPVAWLRYRWCAAERVLKLGRWFQLRLQQAAHKMDVLMTRERRTRCRGS